MSHHCTRSIHSLLSPSVVAFVISVLAGGPAVAANQGNPRQSREDEARSACLDGDYTGGVAILTKLFVETKDITYIFNQGRCLEQNRRYGEAIARFQEYLRAGRRTLDENGRAEAEQRIAECREMLAQERGASPPSMVPLPGSEGTPQEPRVGVAVHEPSPKSTGAGLRAAGIVLASVGVAAVGAGIAFNVKANAMVDDMYTTQDAYTKESDRKTYVTLGWVGYGVGAACVVTGTVIYVLGLRAKKGSTANVAIMPTAAVGQAGVALAGGF